jgi:hypothetical protein
LKELRYAAFLTTHPAKGFWEIKHEKQGSLFTSMLIFFSTVFVLILGELYTGFIFSGGRDTFYSFMSTVVGTSALFMGWCVANWCLTCLFDGEGKLVDIVTATGYALLPFMLIQLLNVFLSNYFIIREQVFYNMLSSVSVVWMIGLILMGVMITHQYGVLKAVVVSAFSVAVMIGIAYLIILFFYLLQQVITFISIYVDEMSIRMAGGVVRMLIPGL